MSTQDVESPSFEVFYMDGSKEVFLNNVTTRYHWSLTPSGDLLIYKKILHAMFASAMIKDERIAAHASGTWKTILTSDEVAPEDEDYVAPPEPPRKKEIIH